LNEKFWQEEPPKQKEVKPHKAKAKTKRTTKSTRVTKKAAKGNKTDSLEISYAGTTAGQTRTDNALAMPLCWCPPGMFQMGSPPGEPERGDDEGPVQVRLSRGFWIGKFPVTQSEYQQLTGELKGTFTSEGYAKAAVTGIDTSRFPVECITWTEAVEFCQQLTQQERDAGRLPHDWEYRLPTEAQWEYACRAGTTTATSFGDKLSSKQANFNGEEPYNGAAGGPNLERPSTVGSYPANAWGLHDMHGNVREFCRDAGGAPLAGGTDPEVVPDKKTLMRAVRGGSWRDEGSMCRSAFRYGMIRTIFDDVLGFRIVCVQT
jgi:formylglycine-generating enzyme required for sulfatase activity